MSVYRLTRFVALAAVMTIPAAAVAQGFGLSEMGSCATGRGYAVSADGCKDASTIYWNPAAAASLSNWSFVLGAADIGIYGQFERDTSHAKYKTDIPHAVVPHFFLNHHSPGSRAAWGIGAYVPYGLTSQWGPEFPGKFAAQRSSLSTIYIQPNFAWQINNRWSVGGGPIYGRSSVELKQAIDLSQQVAAAGSPPTTFAMLGIPARTEFAEANLKGSANGYGAQIGIQGKLTPEWTLGAHYMTQVVFKYDNADATFTQVRTGLVVAAGNTLGPNQTALPAGTPIDALVQSQFTNGALVPQKVSTSITHPAQAQVGLQYSGFAGWNLEADYAWIGWKAFKELPVNFSVAPSRVQIEDYNNSSTIRLGVERLFNSGFKLRGGFMGTASAAPPETVTPLLPEQDREYGNVGFELPIGGKWAIDGSYSHIFTQGQRGRIDDRATRTLTAAQVNTGVYRLSGDVIAVSFKGSY